MTGAYATNDNQPLTAKIRQAKKLEAQNNFPEASLVWEEIKYIAHKNSKQDIKLDDRPFFTRMKFYISIWFMRLTRKFHTVVIIWGLLGQVLFTSRFMVQWIASERRKKSVVPVSFWYLSLLGSGMILVYGLMTSEPVLIMGQFGFLIYLRNIVLIRREKTSA